MDKQLQNLLEAIGETLVEYIIAEGIATGPTTQGYAGLEKSIQVKSVSYDITNNKVQINIPEYTKYIESGRKRRAKKVPISVILKQLKRKNVTPSNSLAFAIQNSIYKKGIRARPFIDRAVKEAQNAITVDIQDYMDTTIQDIINRFNFKK